MPDPDRHITPDDHPTEHRRPGDRHPDGHHLLDEEASELELIQHLARRLRRGSAVETAPWGLSPHQARALSVIARGEMHGRAPRGRGRFRGRGAGQLASATQDGSNAQADAVTSSTGPGLRLGALAEWLHIAPRSATEVVDALEELELVRRAADPTDRRAVLVTLTDQGRQVAGEIRTARLAQAEKVLDELSAAERAQLRASLLTLLKAADR